MGQVIDNASGQVIDHPDADIAADWTAGKVQPVDGQTYHFRFQNGSYGHASTPQEIATAVQQGGQFVSADQAQAAVTAQKYEGETGGAIGAGVAGGASQLTAGLSDVAGRALLGPGFAKARQYQQEAHPVASMVGEGVGAAGLLALTGGGSLAEEAGAGLARAGLGEAAESGLARVASRAVAKGAAASLEGAQFGVSQSISQAAVQDPKLTAEQVIANVGANALWGGLLGGGLGGLGEAIHAKGHLERALEAVPDAADLAQTASKALGTSEPADGLGAKLKRFGAQLSGAVSGHDPDEILNVFERRAELAGADETRDAASRAVRQHVDDVLSAGRDITEEARGSLKRGYLRKAVEGVDAAAAAKSARDLADSAIAKLETMAGGAEEFGGERPLARALTVADGISKKLNKAIENGDVAEQFGLVDDLKKAVGKYTKGAKELVQRGSATDELSSMQNRARADAMADVYEGLRKGLEDESTWGKAAKDQQAINAAWSSQIDASKRFHSALTTEVGRDPNDPWMTVRGVDPAKADAYVRGLLDPSKDLTHKAVTDYVGSTRRLADTIAEAYELPEGKLGQLKRLRDATDAFGQTIDTTSKKLALVNQYKALQEQTAGHAMGFAGVLGHAVGGLPGGIAGMALGKVSDALAHPAETIRKLAVLEQMARESDGRVGRALRAFGVGKGRPASMPALDQYPRRAAQIQRLASDPAALQANAKAATVSLAPHAPQVTAALVGTSIAGVQFLRSKLPPEPPIDPLAPKAKPPLPPPSVRESFLRYQRAVQDPHTVVEDLRDGRLSPEGVEALKTVYPSLYARTQQQTLEALSSGKLDDLSAGQRYGLATLLDLPVPELDPQYIAARQAAITQPLGAFDPQPAKGQGAGAGQKPSRRSKPLPEPQAKLTTEKLEGAQ